MSVKNLFIRTFLNNQQTWLLTFSTNKGFLSTTKYSSVAMKLNYDDAIVDPNQCLSNYYSTVALVTGDNVADSAT